MKNGDSSFLIQFVRESSSGCLIIGLQLSLIPKGFLMTE